MKVQIKKVTVRELVEDYLDDGDSGVTAYGGKLDIRPAYQREFIYKDKQRKAVINTLFMKFPLNAMYWADRGDGTFEVIDGQQRTLSICQYVNGDFAYKERYFHNLLPDEQDLILSYELMVYTCSGGESEKLEWFKTINLAGEKLTDQELRNAVYAGPWVSDAKRYFSRNKCPAYVVGKDLIKGKPIRQEFFETAIKWISRGEIDSYMAQHQHDANASSLWLYFQAATTWASATFPTKSRFRRGVNWGALYDAYKGVVYDVDELAEKAEALFLDDDVTKKSGIYPYLLTEDDRHLSIRAFTHSMKQKAYIKQGGICVKCGGHFEQTEMEADHLTPWHEGGKTIESNCQMLCKLDNRKKSGK